MQKKMEKSRTPPEHNAEKEALRHKRIHRFALIWMQLYKNHDRIPGAYFEDPLFVGDELMAFGFCLEGGRAFAEKYPGLYADIPLTEWKKIFQCVDLQTLGNAIFSKWRYFNHWAIEPMKENDYEWFVLAFERMAKLTE